MNFFRIVLFAFICLPVWGEDNVEQKIIDAMDSGNYFNAIPMLDERIEEQEKKLHYLYEFRGDSYFYLNEFEKAREDYIKALPGSIKGDVEWYLGKTYEKLNDPKKANSKLRIKISIRNRG